MHYLIMMLGVQAALLSKALADLQAPGASLEPGRVWGDPVKLGAIQDALKRPSTGKDFTQVPLVCTDCSTAGPESLAASQAGCTARQPAVKHWGAVELASLLYRYAQ